MTTIAVAAVLGFGIGYGVPAAHDWLQDLVTCWRCAYLAFSGAMESAA
jgi:hypothetical protein